MKTILITVSRGSIIRNYFHTGIIDGFLKEGMRVVALAPFHDNPDLIKELSRPNLIFEPLPSPKNIKAELIFIELFRGLVFNKTIRTYYKYKFLIYEPNYFLYTPRAFFYSLIKFIPGSRRLVRLLDNYLNPQTENDYLFDKYKPELIFVSTPHDRSEVGLVKSARRFNIPAIGMPKTWDNLSKTFFLAKLDHIFLWSKYMQDESIRFQGYNKLQTTVVGIPQFDVYANPRNLLSRVEFCRRLNLDPNKKLIFYGSTGANYEENPYLEIIQRAIESGKLRNVQVLMRPHIGYDGEMDKFNSLEKYSGFIVDRTDKQSSHLKDRWDISIEHLVHLYNSAYHADVCINIASTLTLDATACGTPVVNVCFDPKYEPYHRSIARIYETDYFSSVIKLNGTFVARSAAEFIDFIVEALGNNGSKIKERQRLTEYLIDKVDGKSASRLVSGIVKFLNNKIAAKLN